MEEIKAVVSIPFKKTGCHMKNERMLLRKERIDLLCFLGFTFLIKTSYHLSVLTL